MTARPHTDNKALAILCAFTAVGIATSSDAFVKWMSGSYPVHQLLFIRCLVAFPILIIIARRQASLTGILAEGWQLSVLRGAIMCTAYLAFVLSMATLPMADTIAIYFAMPLFVAVFAGPLLGEHVGVHRWAAIIAGLFGVIVMINPSQGVFEPAALLALYAAIAYALSQSMGRRIVRTISPAIMAIHTNTVYLCVAAILAVTLLGFDPSGIEHKTLAFLVRPWIMPPPADFIAMVLLGTTVAFAMVLFGTAYKYAESSFVAPFEYTAMFWAVALGFVVFGDIPGERTLWGGTIVLSAGLFMLGMDHRLNPKVADAG